MGYVYRTIKQKAGTIKLVTGNYKIDDVEIPSPTSIECEYHILVRALNDGDAITHIIPIRSKRAITLHYKNVSSETYDELHDYMIKENLEKTGKIVFEVQTQFIGYKEPITMKMYLGSPISSQSIHGSKNRMLVNFDIHFIEPEGKALTHLQQ